jgi:hypothetical protein
MLERFCGLLLKAVKSKVNSWGSLAHFAKRTAQILQLRVKFDVLWEVLQRFVPLNDELKRGEICYDTDESCESRFRFQM